MGLARTVQACTEHMADVVQEQQQEVLKLITGQLLKDQEADAKAKKDKEVAEATKLRVAARAREIAAAAAQGLHEEPEAIPPPVSLLPCMLMHSKSQSFGPLCFDGGLFIRL